MRHEMLFEPVDSADPCGPDLDEIGDDEYLNYMLPAEDRLPKRYFDKDTGAPFERGSIDLKAEIEAISNLLRKSRDLRLLALEARFNILAGQISAFSESLQAMSGLVERHWNDVHPRPYEGDYTMRQNTLGALDDRINIILPLQHAPILRDKRLGHITFRNIVVAAGQAEPRAGEEVADLSAINTALAHQDNSEAVRGTHAALLTARDSLSAIRNTFISEAGYEYAPDFDGVGEAIDEILSAIGKAVPELSGTQSEAEPDAGETAAAGETGFPASGEAAPFATAPVADPLATSVKSHAEAAAALFGAERYFLRIEPSAPALILVHQARMLIGKSLPAAIEALMPDSAERALMRFDGALKFQLDMGRMRLLAENAAGAQSETVDPADGEASFNADSRSEAAALINGAETFYRAAEPSSPIPMLLSKARGYLNRDFLAILNELIEKEDQGN